MVHLSSNWIGPDQMPIYVRPSIDLKNGRVNVMVGEKYTGGKTLTVRVVT